MLPLKTMIDNVRSTLFIFTPQRKLTLHDLKPRIRGQPPSAISGSGSSARIAGFAKRTSWRRDVMGFGLSPFSLLRYGIGVGPGRGGTPQMAVTHGGRFGVGISVPFPCVDGEQLGSVAGLQVMQTPVKVSLLG